MTKSQLKEEILKTCFNSANKLNPYIFDNRSKIYNEQITTKILEYTETFNQYNSTFKERVYVLLNDIEDRPKCFCGNPTIFKGKWYTEYCSTKCQHTSPKRLGNIKEKWANKTKEEKDTHVKRNKESKLRNHGNENYNNPKKISETWSNKSEEEIQDFANRGKATKLEKYGAENYCNVEKILETKANFSEEKKEEIKEKIKETCIERYGASTPLQSPEIQEKIKQTFIENYGVEHPMKNKEVVEKLIQRKIENDTHPSNPLIHEKAKQTNIEKYGAITFTSSPEGKQQVIQTSLERYGVTNHTKRDEYKDIIKLIWEEKLPEEIYEIIQKRKLTCVEKYGAEYYAQSNDSKLKFFNETYDKYIQRYSELNIQVLTSKDEYIDFRFDDKCVCKLKCNVCKNEWEDDLSNNGCTSICKICNPYKFSKEREISEYLETYGVNVEFKTRKIISPQEVDIFLPDYNICIEFNGIMFHSFGKSTVTMFNNFSEERTKRLYHLSKTKLVEELGYQLFHINEDEWDNKIKREIWKSMILNKIGLNKRIFARKCSIAQISSSDARTFFEENHLQGYTNSEIKIGLYYESELVSVMTFGKSRYAKDIEYELIRFASKRFLNVIGGASKLLKYFERTFNPKSVVSYANRRWSKGNIYNTLGFNFIEETNPNYFYFNKSGLMESRVKYQKHKLENILPVFDSSLTETENMFNNGYRKMYDSGNLKFIKEY